jgi:hypothetical protein
VRTALAAITLAACSFDLSGPGNAPGPTVDARTGAPDAAAGTPDAPAVHGADAPIASAPCPNDQDLVACWRFETSDAATEPHDDTANRNDGTSSGVGFAPSLPGHGQAMSFSTSASSLVPDATVLTPQQLTVELWVYPRSLPSLGGRSGLIDNNGNYGLFLAPDGTVRCAIGSSTAIGLTVQTNRWTHVACTYDGDTITLYQDGAPGATLADQLGVPTTGTGGVGFGQNSPSGDHLDGLLDDVRIWQVPRDQQQLCTDAAPNC